MKDEIYAPMLIPTLCRSEHFIRCMESLKRNGWAGKTDIYIGLDYPKTEKQMRGYRVIKEYLQGEFPEFHSVTVIEHAENVGSTTNMSSLRNAVKDKYPFFIRTDDDTEFSPNFLEYMNKVLWYYRNSPDVLGVTGYSFPLKWDVKEGCNTFKMNFFCPMWGTAFYTDKYLDVNATINYEFYQKKFDTFIKEKKYIGLSVARFVDFMKDGMNNHETLMHSTTDVGVSTFMPLDGRYCMISPVLSKVRNWGFDGTGEYCEIIEHDHHKKITSKNFCYANQVIDEAEEFVLNPDSSTDYSMNKRILDQFDQRSTFEQIKAKTYLLLYKTFGRDRLQVFRDKVRKVLGAK